MQSYLYIGPPESLPSAVLPRVVSGVPSGEGADFESDAPEVSLAELDAESACVCLISLKVSLLVASSCRASVCALVSSPGFVCLPSSIDFSF
jgi:hypothetical protein